MFERGEVTSAAMHGNAEPYFRATAEPSKAAGIVETGAMLWHSAWKSNMADSVEEQADDDIPTSDFQYRDRTDQSATGAVRLHLIDHDCQHDI